MKRLQYFVDTLLLLLLVLVTAVSANYIYEAISQISWPYIDYFTEGIVLHGVMAVIRGDNIYPSTELSPYIYHIYNPMAYLLPGSIGKILDSDLTNALITGRWISLIASLGLVFVLARLVWMLTGDRVAAVLCGSAVIFFYLFTMPEFVRLRPETPAVLCVFLAVSAYLGKSQRRLIWAAGFAFLAFLFKQPFIAAAIVIPLHLSISGKQKDALFFIIIMIILLAIFFTLMSITTQGEYFRHTILSMASNNLHIWGHFRVYAVYFAKNIGIVMLAIPLCIYLISKHLNKEATSFLLIYFILVFFWTVFTGGKEGAGYNYFSEFSILILLFIMIGIALTRTQPQLRAIIVLLLMIQVGITLHAKGRVFPDIITPWSFTDNPNQPITKIYPFYLDAFGRTSQADMLILDDRLAVHLGQPWALDWFLLEKLEEKGQTDLTPIFSGIDNGEYSKIIFSRRPNTKQLEKRFWTATQNGPYQPGYSDQHLLVWDLIP